MSLDDLVDVEKLRAFEDKVYKMARKEFGTDDEGKINKVQVHLVDRTRYRPEHWFPIAYDHKAKTEAAREELLRNLLINLGLSTDAVKLHLDLERMSKREEQKK